MHVKEDEKMIDRDRLTNQLYDISDRISHLNDMLEASIIPGEIRKIEKAKKKLLKQKDKIYKKIRNLQE